MISQLKYFFFFAKDLYSSIRSGKSEAVKFYNHWMDHVKTTVPAEKLLVFEARHGWKPLCDFLNLPIPEEPYPHLNDTVNLTCDFARIKTIAYIIVYSIPALTAVLLGILWFS